MLVCNLACLAYVCTLLLLGQHQQPTVLPQACLCVQAGVWCTAHQLAQGLCATAAVILPMPELYIYIHLISSLRVPWGCIMFMLPIHGWRHNRCSLHGMQLSHVCVSSSKYLSAGKLAASVIGLHSWLVFVGWVMPETPVSFEELWVLRVHRERNAITRCRTRVSLNSSKVLQSHCVCTSC
jgi:hypothetical protein